MNEGVEERVGALASGACRVRDGRGSWGSLGPDDPAPGGEDARDLPGVGAGDFLNVNGGLSSLPRSD